MFDIHRSRDKLYDLRPLHIDVQQSMCYVTYLIQVYVDSDMSWSVKESFKDIWILTNTMIEKYHFKYDTQINHIVN